MPRRPRPATGGLVFHGRNRSVARMRLSEDEGDCAAFERVLEETQAPLAMRLPAYCLIGRPRNEPGKESA